MPGYIIHIATARRYIENHPQEIKNMEEFIEGTIAPDLTKDKDKSHYGNWKNYQIDIYLDKFIKDKKVNMQKDYWKGYFLHLYLDKKFTHEYFYKEYLEIKRKQDTFHNDYDFLNERLMKEYDIKREECMEEIKENINYIKGNPKYLKYSKVKNMIEEISKIDIEKELKEINKGGSI